MALTTTHYITTIIDKDHSLFMVVLTISTLGMVNTIIKDMRIGLSIQGTGSYAGQYRGSLNGGYNSLVQRDNLLSGETVNLSATFTKNGGIGNITSRHKFLVVTEHPILTRVC